jgi:hypothetical protein
MDKCPKCGHWTMNYSIAKEEWICGCHSFLPKPFKNCACKHKIFESYLSWNRRLLEQNQKGIHSVNPPVIGKQSETEQK